MADRIVLNTISYHGHGAIENIVPELTARGYKKAFVCSDPDLIKFGVTKKVTDLLDAKNYDIVLTCGPMVMMRGVAKLCAAANVPCLASLEKKMACGLGACLGCTCHTKIGPVTVCKDGPVFNAQEVFD